MSFTRHSSGRHRRSAGHSPIATPRILGVVGAVVAVACVAAVGMVHQPSGRIADAAASRPPTVDSSASNASFTSGAAHGPAAALVATPPRHPPTTTSSHTPAPARSSTAAAPPPGQAAPPSRVAHRSHSRPSSVPPPPPARTSPPSGAAGIAAAVVAAINSARAAQGLAPLAVYAGLQRSASAHDQAMAAANQLSHQLPNEPDLGTRETNAGVRWRSAGENIGWTSDMSQAGALGIEASMLGETPPNDGHRRNILSSSFTVVGVDVYLDTAHGRLWLTEDFAQLQ